MSTKVFLHYTTAEAGEGDNVMDVTELIKRILPGMQPPVTAIVLSAKTATGKTCRVSLSGEGVKVYEKPK